MGRRSSNFKCGTCGCTFHIIYKKPYQGNWMKCMEARYCPMCGNSRGSGQKEDKHGE